MRTEKLYSTASSATFTISRGGLLRHVLLSASGTPVGNSEFTFIVGLKISPVASLVQAQTQDTIASLLLSGGSSGDPAGVSGGQHEAVWLDFIDFQIDDNQRVYLLWEVIEGALSNIQSVCILFIEDLPRSSLPQARGSQQRTTFREDTP